VAGLRPGELLSVGDLLAAMLLPSGGDAAHTLAVDLAGSTDRFVGWMNAAAAALNMGRTHYSTPVGLDTPGNYSTVADLARLAGALLADPFFARTVSRPRIRLADGRTVVNRNDLVGRYPFVVGIKTGSTGAAGYCLVGAGRRDGATVVSVVLGESSEAARDADTLALLRYGLSLYHGVLAVHRGRVYARVPVAGRPLERLSLVAARAITLVVRRGARLALFPRRLAALAMGPLPSHTPLGRLDVELAGRVVARVPLLSRGPLAPPPAARPPAAPPPAPAP
jgi:D-alanyl-D-alanine carboxypeptidase (penicillin-binding protein 5/6)